MLQLRDSLYAGFGRMHIAAGQAVRVRGVRSRGIFPFSLLPIFPIKLIVGRKMNYPNADDWGHIQVASGLIYYAFLCVVKAHFDAVMEVKTLGYKGILARLSPVARRVSLDCIFFVTLGLTAVSVHLWTMSVSGNDGKGGNFPCEDWFCSCLRWRVAVPL